LRYQEIAAGNAGGYMNRVSKFLAATFLSAAMFIAGAAQVEIWQFDKMADEDQADYIQALVDGAQKVLKDEGRSDLANKMDQLFTEIHHGDTMSLGMIEFERNLALARVDDAKNAAAHPNDPRLEVEDAMFVTLQKNHIDLPDSFYTVARNFKPALPPAKEKKEK
jgi:hypothetical protein